MMNFLNQNQNKQQIEVISIEKTFKRYKFYVERVTDTDGNSRQMVSRQTMRLKKTDESVFMFDEKNELYYNTLFDAINAIKPVINHISGYWAYIKIAEVIVEDKIIKSGKEQKLKKFYTKILKPEYTYIVSQYRTPKQTNKDRKQI